MTVCLFSSLNLILKLIWILSNSCDCIQKQLLYINTKSIQQT